MKKVNYFTKTLLKATFCLALVLTLGGLTACNSDLEGEEAGRSIPDARPIILDLTEKIETDNSFAFDLFRTTTQFSDETNVFVSPLSVNMALSMTMNGAAGQTLDEMKEALRATDYSMDDINQYNKALREALLKVDPSTTISIANSIWYHNTLAVKDEFISVNKDCYDAEIKMLDFKSPDAVKQINNWVSDKTNKKIPDIIKQLSPDEVMCLINAIYFKGIWSLKLDKKETKEEDFHPENASKHKVDMMKKTALFLYSEDEHCRYLRMAYGNGAFSMVVMLPKDDTKIETVLANLNNESWRNAMWTMGTYEVNLRLPRFKCEGEYQMHQSILPAMGMVNPFTDFANFSGISDTRLKISRVIHKTFVDVNEEGTEAAAVTAVIMAELSAISTPPVIPKIDYVVNKPFAFAICENSTGLILFIGKMGDIR
jgi:serpin B